jgi:hypothetical protein
VSAVVERASGPGRSPCCPRELAEYIRELNAQGLSVRKIRDRLNAEGVLTPKGCFPWHASYVDRILKTKYMRELDKGTGSAA